MSDPVAPQYPENFEQLLQMGVELSVQGGRDGNWTADTEHGIVPVVLADEDTVSIDPSLKLVIMIPAREDDKHLRGQAIQPSLSDFLAGSLAFREGLATPTGTHNMWGKALAAAIEFHRTNLELEKVREGAVELRRKQVEVEYSIDLFSGMADSQVNDHALGLLDLHVRQYQLKTTMRRLMDNLVGEQHG